MSEERIEFSNPNRRSWIVALLLSVILGKLGIDRFYLGKHGTGVLKLITIGGLGIWYIIDIILIATATIKDVDGNEMRGVPEFIRNN